MRFFKRTRRDEVLARKLADSICSGVPFCTADPAIVSDVVLLILRGSVGHVEYILDNPASANWRLKNDHRWPRVAYYGNGEYQQGIEKLIAEELRRIGK